MSIDLERFPWSDSANRMLTYVTKGWYDKSYACRFCRMANGYRPGWKWMLSGTGIWWAHRIVVTWNIFRQGYNRSQTYRPKGRKAPGRAQGYF